MDEACKDDGFQTTARSLHSWLTRVLYNKRCKFDPLWTTFVVAGLDQDKPWVGLNLSPDLLVISSGVFKVNHLKLILICDRFLGFVDKLGTAYTDPIITTGYASMLATPLIRKAVEDKLKDKNEKLTLAEARKVIEDSLTLMYYRDARASNKVRSIF